MKRYEPLPGDLIVCPDPLGQLRMCERVGEDCVGFGDVTFTYTAPTGAVFLAELRTPNVDRLIGSKFRSFADARKAVFAVMPDADARFLAAAKARGIKEMTRKIDR